MMTWTFFGALFHPSVEDATFKWVNDNLSGLPFVIGNYVLIIRHFAFCAGDYIGCVKQESSQNFGMTFGWKDGKGVMPLLSLGSYESPVHFSHAEYKKIAYDPKAGRPSWALFTSLISKLPEGVMTSPDLMIQFDTGSAEHTARRQLLSDGVPALAFDHVGPAMVVPPGVSASDAAVFGHPLSGLQPFLLATPLGGKLKRSVFDMLALNLYKGMFGIDITTELDAHAEHDGMIAGVALGTPLTAAQGKRLAEIKQLIMDKMLVSDVGKSFMAIAKERGMNGPERLHELLWIASFAGYGGSGNLCFYTVKHVLKKPAEYVKLFRSNPEAFVLESARLYPPVAGMNPFAVRKEETMKFANGRTLHVKNDTAGLIFTSNANMDPQVFDEPDEFRPGRDHALKVLSWNNEVGDFRKCATPAGCPEAPRACPGMHLSIRLVIKVVEFFVGGIEKGLGLPNGKIEL